MWLRPGVVHASCGAVDILRSLVARLRAAWPGVQILLRADNGLGVPAVYDFCESDGLEYVIGYATNAVLERATAQALADVELYYRFYGRRDPHVQRFEEVRDYQAGGWPHARRVVVKVERNPQGSQRRYVVTNRTEAAAVVYREIYVQRGAVPEQPIGEMKNGLRCERSVVQRFLRQGLSVADPRTGVCHRGAVPRGGGRRAGGGDGVGGDVAATIVEGGRGGGDESAAGVRPGVECVAVPGRVAARPGGGDALRSPVAR